VTLKPPSQDDDPKPLPPERPALEDCCHGGCTPCIFDLYEADLERYRAALDAWEKRRAARRKSRGH
jgi:hypothetical protein